jgi:hypothetical protein
MTGKMNWNRVRKERWILDYGTEKTEVRFFVFGHHPPDAETLLLR